MSYQKKRDLPNEVPKFNPWLNGNTVDKCFKKNPDKPIITISEKSVKETSEKSVQVNIYTHFFNKTPGDQLYIEQHKTIKKKANDFAKWMDEVKSCVDLEFIAKVYKKNQKKISYSTLFLMHFLEKNGIKVYLGGGAVRDLLILEIMEQKDKIKSNFLKKHHEQVKQFIAKHKNTLDNPNDFDLIIDADYKKILKLMPGIAKIIGRNYKIVTISADVGIDVGQIKHDLKNHAKNANVTYNTLYWSIREKVLNFDTIIDYVNGRLDIINRVTNIVNINEPFLEYYFATYPDKLIRCIYSNHKLGFSFNQKLEKILIEKFGSIYGKTEYIQGTGVTFTHNNSNSAFFYLSYKLLLAKNGLSSLEWIKKNGLIPDLFMMIEKLHDTAEEKIYVLLKHIIEEYNYKNQECQHKPKINKDSLFHATFLYLHVWLSNPKDDNINMKKIAYSNFHVSLYLKPNNQNILCAMKIVYKVFGVNSSIEENIEPEFEILKKAINEINNKTKDLQPNIDKQKLNHHQ